MIARIVLAPVVVAAVAAALVAALPSVRSIAAESAVQRGRYLVEDAGRCENCHGQGLHGAPLDFLAPGLPVARRAPQIAGLPMLTTPEAVNFLETGILPGGKHARPPMPQYRFRHDDAAAIVAYLKQLH